MTVAQGPDAGADNPATALLEDLAETLSSAGINSTRNANSLTVKYGELVTRLEVLRPCGQKDARDPIREVVRVTTELPHRMAASVAAKASALNKLASSGAITEEDGKLFVGSCVTQFENEDAYELHLPFLYWSIAKGADAIFGATGRAGWETGASAWLAGDLAQTRRALSPVVRCNAGDTRLTAEFPLERGAVSALLGHHHTALWRMVTAPIRSSAAACSASLSFHIASRTGGSSPTRSANSTGWRWRRMICLLTLAPGAKATWATTRHTCRSCPTPCTACPGSLRTSRSGPTTARRGQTRCLPGWPQDDQGAHEAHPNPAASQAGGDRVYGAVVA